MGDLGRIDDAEETALDALVDEILAGQPTGEAALRHALLLFDSWQLPLPPIPGELAPSLHVLGRGLLGTRQGTPSPYGLGWFLDDLAADPRDYLVFGHAGHGTNFWAMHYYLVSASLALFLQIPWGGAHTDAGRATAAVQSAFAGAGRLILHEGRLGRLPPGQRLVVIDSELVPSRWGIAGPQAGLAALQPQPRPLDAALAWAEEGGGRETSRFPPGSPIWG